MINKDVVVTGIGVTTPMTLCLPDKASVDCQLQERNSIQVADIAHGLSARQLKKLDKFSVIAITAIKQALKDHVLTAEQDKTGLIIGNVFGGWSYVEDQLYELYQGNFSAINAYVATAWFPAAPQGECSILMGFKGYSKTISADTLSSAYAIEHAIHLITDKTLHMVCSGGVEAAVTPLIELATQEVMTDAGMFFCLQHRQHLEDTSHYKFTIEYIGFSRDVTEVLSIAMQFLDNTNSLLLSKNIEPDEFDMLRQQITHQYISDQLTGNTYGAAFALDIYLAYQASLQHTGKAMVIRKNNDGQYVLGIVFSDLS